MKTRICSTHNSHEHLITVSLCDFQRPKPVFPSCNGEFASSTSSPRSGPSRLLLSVIGQDLLDTADLALVTATVDLLVSASTDANVRLQGT